MLAVRNALTPIMATFLIVVMVVKLSKKEGGIRIKEDEKKSGCRVDQNGIYVIFSENWKVSFASGFTFPPCGRVSIPALARSARGQSPYRSIRDR